MNTAFQASQEPRKQKRHRISLSCVPCRIKKSKCSRGTPCDQCVKRGVECKYQTPVWTQAEQDESFGVHRFVNTVSAPSAVGDRPLKRKRLTLSKKETSTGGGYSRKGHGDDDDDDDDGVEASLKEQLSSLRAKLREIEAHIKHDGARLEKPVDSYNDDDDDDDDDGAGEILSRRQVSGAFGRSKNPTFVGINPYHEGRNETISFYEGYSAVHERDLSRRMNHGPFSWLSILKRDPAMNNTWKYLQKLRSENKRVIDETPRYSRIPASVTDKDSPGANHEDQVRDGGGGACHSNDDEFREKTLDEQGFNDVRLYGNVRTNFKQSNSRRGCSGLGLTGDEAGNGVANLCDDRGRRIYLKRKAHLETKEDSQHAIHSEKQSSLQSPSSSQQQPPPPPYSLDHIDPHRRGKIEEELKLIECVSKVLPKQKVIWLSIDYFFKYIYPYMPILDESNFTQEIEKLIGKKEFNDDEVELKIEKRLDFAFLSALLIILRLNYISLISNRCGINEANMNKRTTENASTAGGNSEKCAKDVDDLSYLLQNPVDAKVMAMAELCLDQFDLYRRTSLIVLQSTFLLKMFHMFSPEDGDGTDGGDSQVHNGLTIQMAIGVGLNRDADFLPDCDQDPKLHNLYRKIWFFTIIFDLIQGYQYGNPLVIHDRMYDTKLPFYQRGNENILDVKMEKHVIAAFAYFEKYHDKLLAILENCLDLKHRVQLKKLTGCITEFEVFLKDNYGVLNDFLVPFDPNRDQYPFSKVMKCKNYINMKMFLNVTFFHLYLHYENQLQKSSDTTVNRLALFYFKKIMAVCYGEFFPAIFKLLLDGAKNFGTGIATDMILNPTVLSMVHKLSLVNFAILLRLNTAVFLLKQNDIQHNFGLQNDPNYRLRYAKLVKMSKLVQKMSEICLSAMSRLSQRYYYAWRVTKAHTFIMKNIILKDDYYKNIAKDKLVSFLPCSDEELGELSLICETSLKNYSKFKVGDNLEAVDLICGKNNHCPNEKHHANDKQQPHEETALLQPPTRAQADLKVVLDNHLNKPGVLDHPSTHTQTSNTSVFGNEDTVPVLANPLSNESWSDIDDFKFLNNDEIDNLWIAMKMKTDPSTGGLASSANVDNANLFGAQFASLPPSVVTPVYQSGLSPQVVSAPPDVVHAGATPASGRNEPAGGGGEMKTWRTWNEFDLFNALSLEEMLGLSNNQ